MGIRPESINYIEENIGRSLCDIEAKGIFQYEVPLTKQIEVKINTCDYIKQEVSVAQGSDVQNTKKGHRLGESICPPLIQQGLIPKIYKALIKFHNKKHPTLSKKEKR